MHQTRFSYATFFMYLVLSMLIGVAASLASVHSLFAAKERTEIIQSAQLIAPAHNTPMREKMSGEIWTTFPVATEREDALQTPSDTETVQPVIKTVSIPQKTSVSHRSLIQKSAVVVPPLTITDSLPFSAVDMLSAHNIIREKAGVPPLAWSESLTQSAQKWADALYTRGCIMEHEQQSQYGENIYVFWRTQESGIALMKSPAYVIGRLASEETNYDYTSNSCIPGEKCGHYTQLVWKDTAEVGCGARICLDGDKQTDVWVCRYSPPGNTGERPY